MYMYKNNLHRNCMNKCKYHLVQYCIRDMKLTKSLKLTNEVPLKKTADA